MRRPSCLLIGFLFATLFSPDLYLARLTAAPVQPVEPVRSPLERPPARRPRPVSPWLLVNRHAGLAFEGTVLHVGREPLRNSRSLPTVKISFRVQRAIRGVHDGQVLTIHEWAGLWSAGERYWPGERLVLFLYPPSRLGLTSPVSEVAGRFSVSAEGKVRLSKLQEAWFESQEIPGWPVREAVPVEEFLQQVRQEIGGRP